MLDYFGLLGVQEEGSSGELLRQPGFWWLAGCWAPSCGAGRDASAGHAEEVKAGSWERRWRQTVQREGDTPGTAA